MCGTCGCSEPEEPIHQTKKVSSLTHPEHHHDRITIEANILTKNNQFATNNRQYFQERQITALNIMSSPGAGKTTLLCKTLQDLNHFHAMAVLVGDQQTDEDAAVLSATGAKALQINTGQVCHLDAHRVGHCIEAMALSPRSILFIENIGNLVCPALFDLGETFKIVILSITEGDNKPIKYPDMFRNADLLLLTKMDLLPFVDFDTNKCIDYARSINPNIAWLSLSATTGVGLKSWYHWLASKHTAV